MIISSLDLFTLLPPSSKDRIFRGVLKLALSSLPLVSIVTPLYNAEKYLSTCVESVLSQTYENWHYTIVNNCSTDRSREIARSYARQHQRIRVLDNSTFLAQVPNLNYTIRQVSSESKYCKVVFADDWLFHDCLQRMIEVAEAHPTVGMVGAYRLDDVWVKCDGLPYPSTFMPGREICRLQLLKDLFVFGSPNSLLIRSDLVRERNPFYSEKSLHEDTEACYEILRDWDFGFVHQVLTFTRRENESVSSSFREFNPNCLDKYIIVKKYGSLFLSSEEYKTCRSYTEERYFKFLGENALRSRGEKFWNYHREGLLTLGEGLNQWKIARYALKELLDLVLNPKMTAAILLRHLFRT